MNNNKVGTLSNKDIDYIHKSARQHYSDGNAIECEGVIIVLDVLGWQKTATKETITNLFNQLNRFRSHCLDICLRCSDNIDKFNVFANAIADNIVIFINGDFPYHSYNVFNELGKLVANSLEMGIAFRGAINYGKFYINKLGSSYVGEAVYNSIKNADKTDWAGIIIMNPLAEILLKNKKIEDLNEFNIIQYNEIPYKSTDYKELSRHNLVIKPNRNFTNIDYIKSYEQYMAGEREDIKLKKENTIKFIKFLEENYWRE